MKTKMSCFPFTRMNEKAQYQMAVLILEEVYQNCPSVSSLTSLQAHLAYSQDMDWTSLDPCGCTFSSVSHRKALPLLCDSSRTCAAGRRHHPACTTAKDRTTHRRSIRKGDKSAGMKY